MAVLSDEDRAELTAEILRDLSRGREPLNSDKAQARAVVNAIDDFLNTNAIAMNNAIPQPQRANYTTSQKARFYAGTIAKRWVKGA